MSIFAKASFAISASREFEGAKLRDGVGTRACMNLASSSREAAARSVTVRGVMKGVASSGRYWLTRDGTGKAR